MVITDADKVSPTASAKRTGKAKQERRLVHRQSTPNMRRMEGNPTKQTAKNGQKKDTNASNNSPESVSAGNNTPAAEALSAESTPCTQSVPVSLASSPKMDTSTSASPDGDGPRSPIAGSRFRTRTMQYRMSSSKELTVDASCTCTSGGGSSVASPTGSVPSSDFLLLTVEEDKTISEPLPSLPFEIMHERKVHHHKDPSRNSASCTTLPSSGRPTIRVKPPPEAEKNPTD